MVPSTNLGNTPLTSTITALAKVQPRSRIPRQLRIRRATHLTSHILHDILPQKRFNILGDVFAPNDQTLITINTSLSTQFRHEELKHMLRTTLHHGTNLLKVDPKCLLGTHTGKLGRLHGTTLLLNKVGVLSVKDSHDTIEHIFIRILGLTIISVIFLTMSILLFEDETTLFIEAGVIVSRGGGGIASGGRVLFFFVLLLLFLLLFGEVEHFG
mmetsp:Transcript_18297/g.27560  ORF Transcript_18297/g.27560 Transcript_18297/m.27560 type:complete len:213 (+) Transcript_18297:349-987(+)